MGKGKGNPTESEFDAQRNSVLYGCICFCITICGILIALGFAYGLDGSCVTNSFFDGKSPKDCISGKVVPSTIDKTCPKGYWGKDCLPCLNCYGHGVCYGSGTTDKFTAPGDGTCLCNKGFGGIHCAQCLPGFYGPDCKPCDDCNGPNNGVCIGTGSIGSKAANSGACRCYYPFTGKNCNECLPGLFGKNCNLKCDSSTCINGVCSTTSKNVLTNSTSICKCNEGYKGNNCNQCENGYDLSASTNSNNNNNNNQNQNQNVANQCIFNYTAYCIKNKSITTINSKNYMNYYGKDCTACNSNACSGHGKCSSGINGGGHCTCDDNWSGTTCNVNETSIIVAYTRCNTNDDATLCNSNGLCYTSNTNNKKICICSKGYTGNNCTKCDDGYEPKATASSSSPMQCKSVCALSGMEHCYGHGTCNTLTKTCTCATNSTPVSGFYTGQYCNKCAANAYGSNCKTCPGGANKCSNGGKCKGSGTTEGDGTCACETGYEGSKCDDCSYGFLMNKVLQTCKRCPVNAITNKICNEPYGSCSINTNNAAVCKCVNGYKGTTCGEKKISSASCLKNCHGNGKCSNGICFCNSEFTGAYCNITAQPKCTKTSCSACETCNSNTGFCELIDRCCGRGEYFNDQCYCKRGYTGVDCSATLTVTEQAVKHYAWKWIDGDYEVDKDTGRMCSKLCGGGLKKRVIQCVEYTNEKDTTKFETVADVKCTGLKQPHSYIDCNVFNCSSGADANTDVRVVTLIFDMDYTTVMTSAEVSKSFEKSLVEDFNILTNGITNENNMEIMALKRGSVKAYVVLYTNNNEQVLKKIDAAMEGTTAAAASTTTTTETTIGRNVIQALKIITKTKKIIKSDKLDSKEANSYVIKNKDAAAPTVAASASGTGPNVASDDGKDSSVTSGGAAAISIIIVFVFIGLIIGIGGFIRAKKDWIKKMATQSTASRPSQVQIKLTAEEHNNPLMLQMSGDVKAMKGASNKKNTALARAVTTVQRAIQLDNEHNWKEAVKFYKKANDQFAVVLENETNANTRFALAKKVNGYLEREQFLTKKLGGGDMP